LLVNGNLCPAIFPVRTNRAIIAAIVLRAFVFSLSFVLATPWVASAQPHSAATDEPRPEDLQAAAAAFAEGQRAQLRGDYVQAAEFFELADRSAPNAVALRSAIRSHRAGGHRARAATLSLEALSRYASDAETRAVADEVLAESAPMLARVRVECTPACSLVLDGRALRDTASDVFDFFVEEGQRHLSASWPGRPTARRDLEFGPHTEHTIELVAPASPEPVATERAPDDELHDEPVRDAIAMPAPVPASDSSGLSPAIFATGAGLTAVALGIGIGFGIDTLSARDAYVADPTRERYEQGIDRQNLTNGFLFGAAALGIGTFVIAFFTDWDGDSSGESSSSLSLPWFYADEHGLVLGLSQSFGDDT
jgi:hypothetical protein